jgi:Family of unknown function (DUF6504)
MYGEPVNVQSRDDGRPVRFVWRGRLYTVRAILEHWVVNREWWQDPSPAEPAAGPPEQPSAAQPKQPKQPKQPDQPAPPDQPTPPDQRTPPDQPEQPGQPEPSSAGQPELEFWRVEASPGQGITAGAYELRRDAATDAWTLRVS